MANTKFSSWTSSKFKVFIQEHFLSGLWYGKKKHNMQIFQDVPDLETSADSADKTEPEPAVKSSDEIERSLPAPTPINANTSDLYT